VERLGIPDFYGERDAQVFEIRRRMSELSNELFGLAKKLNKNAESPDNLFISERPIHLNGDDTDNSKGNLAIKCPCCTALIRLAPYSAKDIWLLKTKGLNNNAEIGRTLGISRERVRQLAKRYQVQLQKQSTFDVDDLVKRAQELERNGLCYTHRSPPMTIRAAKIALTKAKKEAYSIIEDAEYEAEQIVDDAQDELERALKNRGGRPGAPRLKSKVTDKRILKKRILQVASEMGLSPITKEENSERLNKTEK